MAIEMCGETTARWRCGPMDRKRTTYLSPAENESDEVRKAIAPFERLDPLGRVIEGLDGLTAKTGWRCMADDAVMFSKDAQPFVSDKLQIKIRVEFNTSRVSPLAELKFLTKSLGPVEVERPSAVIAESLSKTKTWSKTLIKVDTQIEKTKPWTRGDTNRRKFNRSTTRTCHLSNECHGLLATEEEDHRPDSNVKKKSRK